MRDRSLDEFLPADEEREGDDPGAETTDATTTGDDDPDATTTGDRNGDVEADGDDEATPEDAKTGDGAASHDAGSGSEATPATPTMRFVRSGTCPACGASTTRLWNDGDGERFVCADCKEF